MSRSIFIISILLIHLGVNAQPSQVITPIKTSSHNMFDFLQKDITYNEIDYRVYIAIPKGEMQQRPVLYMLDGNGQFPLLINQIESVDVQSPIIVGIGYQSEKAYPEDRTRDYTIKTDGEDKGGGAESFYSFIQEIIKPHIESAYHVDIKRQSLCGHSLGGIFSLYVLFNHTSSFQHYIAGSPSLWWGNGAIIPAYRPLFTDLPKSVSITIGEYEENPELDPSRKDMPAEIRAIKDSRRSDISTREFFRIISDEVPECSLTVFEGKNHGSSVKSFLMTAYNTAMQ